MDEPSPMTTNRPPEPRRHPFREFIVKMHSRCNLACDYCYIYTMADQRWRSRPKQISAAMVEQTAARIAEHAQSQRLAAVNVILHGGEPLLAGAERITHCAAALRAAMPPGVRVALHLQTNGTLLDREMLGLLRNLRIRVGVSLDGDRLAHDRHRRRASGAGSHSTIRRALLDLSRGANREIFSGLLCTIDLRNDPVATYEALLEYQPPAVDFLLPQGNWSAPPPGRPADPGRTPYAEWLFAAFQRWYGAARQETRVRLFEAIVSLLLGGRSTVEGLGLEPTPMVVIETDGSIERSDSLHSTYSGAAATGLHVERNSFDQALDHAGIAAMRSGAAALPAACRRCSNVRICGGGLYAHRYRAGGGFANPSVYCPDLYLLINRCRQRLAGDVAELRASLQHDPA